MASETYARPRGGNSKSNGHLFYRKIQRLGASSLIVTLPKEWAKRHGIKYGDVLTLFDEGDKLVIAPNNTRNMINLEFSLNHTHVERHVNRLVLCSYVFGFDEVRFISGKNIRKEQYERVKKMELILPNVEVRYDKNEINVKLGRRNENLVDRLIEYGRLISKLFADYVSLLASQRIPTDRELEVIRRELEVRYEHLMRINYLLLRTANSVKSYNKMHERKCRYMVSASNLIGIIADSAYKLGLDLITMLNHLSEDEKERLAFLLQILEVAISTTVLSVKPPSVRKSEESYMKVSYILSMEGDLAEVVSNSSPAFAYFLAKILEIARIVEIAEHIMLCNALIEKYNQAGPSNSPNLVM